jgi:hypothetical protein
LPAAVVSVMPSLSADSLAPLAIATKKGFVEVFVIRVTPIGPLAAPEPLALAGPEPDAAAGAEPDAAGAAVLPPELQAANRTPAVARAARPRTRFPRFDWFTLVSSDGPLSGARLARPDNVVSGL